MNIAYFNGNFLPKNEIMISSDDRGFLFADGIYEVIRWYESFFYDMDSHVTRMKRSLRELRINWPDADLFPSIASDLIKSNKLENQPAMIYLQVTRGAATRTHSFPSPEVKPTIYAYAWGFIPDNQSKADGIKVMIKEDIRWSRCDIKSVALLANTISFQEAHENGLKECIFVRNGLITEGSRSNIFFVIDGTLFTHPESNQILSGVTRKNVLKIARDCGIKIREEPVQENRIRLIQEAFITNTSAEVTPVTEIGGNTLGNGVPGPITRLICEKFDTKIKTLQG
ncbi:MAG: D-alanine aminotransferase Dat [Bacteroidetes bacterium]|nr:MAG: D-alanine aminotransferase Dat [Bacteroidota bacterium]